MSSFFLNVVGYCDSSL